MATSLAIRLEPEDMRSLAFGSITSSYMGIGTAFTKPIRIFLVQNLTDVLMIFSFDGANDHFPLPSNGYMLLDISANKTREQGYYIAEGTRVYVKDNGDSPTMGSVYITTFYGAD